MKIKNSKKWGRYSIKQASAGTALILLTAFALRYFIHPLVEPHVVFHFFIAASLAVQYLFGYRFSITSVLLSMVLGEYYFVEPYASFDELSKKDFIISVNFALVALTAIAFMENLSRSIFERDLLLKVFESRNKISLYRENDRISFAEKNSETWAILEKLLNNFDDILLIKLNDSAYKPGPLFLKITKNNISQNDLIHWQDGIYFDDKSLIENIFNPEVPKTERPRAFDLRLIQADGGLHACRVCVDHFRFMGQQLAILRADSGKNRPH